jgi:hypothetical protein
VLLEKGKTNHGQVLYGRALRHKDVLLCFVGSLAFYLAYRFFLTNEFDEEIFMVDWWLDNKKWYNVKLLVDASAESNHEKPMGNSTYSSAIKKVCLRLMIASKHWLHLGRHLGAKILEFVEEVAEEIRCLGNWDPKIQETSYSTKLPWRPMRKLAGFTTGNNMYYNPRSTVEPPESLIEKTPFFRFSTPFEFIDAKIKNDNEECWTAYEFLKLMKLLGVVFLQDAAAIWVLHPARKEHPMFSMPVFRDPEWLVSIFIFLFFLFLLQCTHLSPASEYIFFQVYVEEMRTELASADTSLLDHSVESVLPGVHQYLSSLHSEVRAARTETRTDISELTQKLESRSDSNIEASVEKAVQRCLGPALQPYSCLANSLNVMAASLRSGLHVPTASAATNAIRPLDAEESPLNPANSMEVDDDEALPPGSSRSQPPRLQDGIGHHPKPAYVSIHELYDEFYGLGRCQGKPVIGGFAKLEEDFKTKWRQGFSGGQKKEWSRLTMAIRGINRHIAELGDKERALDNLDLVFREKHGVNHTLSKLVQHMQEKGILTKGRARGRYAPINVSTV